MTQVSGDEPSMHRKIMWSKREKNKLTKFTCSTQHNTNKGKCWRDSHLQYKFHVDLEKKKLPGDSVSLRTQWWCVFCLFLSLFVWCVCMLWMFCGVVWGVGCAVVCETGVGSVRERGDGGGTMCVACVCVVCGVCTVCVVRTVCVCLWHVACVWLQDSHFQHEFPMCFNPRREMITSPSFHHCCHDMIVSPKCLSHETKSAMVPSGCSCWPILRPCWQCSRPLHFQQNK